MQNKIIVKGAYGQPNFGDDILMLIINNILVSKNEDFKILVPSKGKYVETLINEDNVLYKSESLVKTDFLIFGGGTQFYSFPKTKQNARIQLIKKIIKNPLYFFSYFKTRKEVNNSKIEANNEIALGLGIGPFEGIDSTLVIKNTVATIKKMKFIMVRDIVSYNFLVDNKIDNIFLANDLCFSPSKFLPFKITERKRNSEIKKITFILRDWNHTNDKIHIQNSIKFIQNNRKNKTYKAINVVLFANDSYCEKKLIDNNIDYLKWNPNTQNIQGFLNTIYETDLIVSSRYHGVVLSSLVKVPFLPIEIDPKLSIFTKDIYGENVGWKYPYSQDGLKEQIDSITIKKEKLISHSEHKTKKYIGLVEESLNTLKSIINE